MYIVRQYLYGLIYGFDDYIDALLHFVATQVVLAPLLLLFVEEAGIPIIVPGDVILAYTGYVLSTTQRSSLAIAYVVALAAVLGGSTILFFVSRRYGQWLITKVGKFIFLEERHIQRAERLFAKFGPLAIIFGRHIPGLRIPITVFAATSGVRYWVFILSTFISTSAWILFYLTVGTRIGINFRDTFEKYVGISLLVVVVVSAAIVLLHVIGQRRHAKPDDPKKGG